MYSGSSYDANAEAIAATADSRADASSVAHQQRHLHFVVSFFFGIPLLLFWLFYFFRVVSFTINDFKNA